ncbi:hypothetical protein SI65_04769 [Aspergillus cristatus]|uniref:Isotrichodermin C-15 hydroxylase n=1 Tax=Aspergillus cristatus TaxID=573508 RepID=A0A1E3BFQ0_ASPCR|nr:hypothetical protein SI65_04769 [Aspergillus cristatus]
MDISTVGVAFGVKSWCINLAGILGLIWISYTIIYNLYWTSLKHFPGPLLWKVSRIPAQLSMLRGFSHLDVTALHERYGPAVRIGPNELAFNTPQAFRDIYNSRSGKCFPKARSYYPLPVNGVEPVSVAVEDDVHARQRRLLSYGFSDRALREQEGLIMGFVNTLIERLTGEVEKGSGEAKVDIKEWMNFATFDITGELTFGESFNCLQDSELHPWIGVIFKSIKQGSYLIVAGQFPWAQKLLVKMIPQRLMQKAFDHFNLSAMKADRRLANKTSRPDFMSAILKGGLSEEPGVYRGSEKIMSRDEVHSNALMLILAGSETSATLLSGCVYYICRHPTALRKLTKEVRSFLTGDQDITMSKTSKLPYLAAVIEETLRLYPPVAAGLRRIVPKGGATIDEYFVPENTIVACHQYASFHSSSNFACPDDFIPERWLGIDPRFDDDKRTALQPFSLGPRNCPGKNLAYSQVRLILCKLLYNFDVELRSECTDWIDQESYFLWDKPALWVTLKERIPRT